MTKFTHLLFSATVVAACAAAQTPPSGPDASQQNLKQAIALRDQTAKQVSAETPAVREKCEAMSGDCLIQLRERRSEFFISHETLECPPVTMPEERLQCIVGEVDRSGNAREAEQLSDFYGFEAKCLEGLLRCAVDVKQKAAVAAIDARTEERRQQVETSPAAVEARVAVEAAREKVKYIRLTFPVQTDALCAETEALERCVTQAEESLSPLDGMLRKDPGYDAQAAISLYQTSKRSEAACHDPEFQCLASKLQGFGASDETKPFMQQNLALIEQRQKLVDQLDQTVAQSCLQQGMNQHQASILQRFQDYARESKMYFRLQLDRAFVAMHASQVECLKSRTKGSSG